jgi:hypothetical protein
MQRNGFRESQPSDLAGVPWVEGEGLLVVPESACWPRFMSLPHPDAIGSYGAELGQFALDRTGKPLDWWQRLISARILEHDADGELCWQEWILTVARQLGKSYWWRELCLWRMSKADDIGEPQEILHIANKLKVANKIQRPARAWAETQDGWDARHGNGQQEVRRGLSIWSLSTAEGAYGYTISLAGVDEAWAIHPDHIDDGVVPTMLESKWSQLGIISTAHHLATPLVIDRRASALDGDGSLLIEWSARPWLPLEDRAGWRQASPRWTPKREALIARELARALGNQTLSTDPVAFFRSQYLNQWPSKAAHSLTKSGLPLLPEGIWQELAGDAETPGAVVFGLEDIFGRGVAVAAASRALDGRIVVQGFELGDRTVAFEWIGMHARSHPGSSLVVGPALQNDPQLGELGIPIETASYAETKACLSQLRQLVSRRLVMHANSPLLSEQMINCRVTETSGIRVISTDPWELVRAASWAAVHLERERRAINIW